MSKVEPTNLRSSITPSTVSVSTPRDQTAELLDGFIPGIVSEEIDDADDDEPLDIHSGLELSSQDIDKHPNWHQPPIPLFQPVDTEPPSKGEQTLHSNIPNKLGDGPRG